MSSFSVTPSSAEHEDSKPITVEVWKTLRWVLLILAIIVRCYIVYHDSPLIGTDQGFQLAASRSLLLGEGITLSTFELKDLSLTQAHTLTWWPPLFSVVAAPALALVNDPLFVLVMFSWLAMILIFIGWFMIMETLGSALDWRAKTLTWIFWALFAPPFTYQSTGVTDYLSLGLFLMAIAFGLIAVQRLRIGWAILAGTMIGLSASLRYAYVPLLIIIPMGFIICTILRRDRQFIRHAIVSGAVGAAIISFGALSQLLLDASNPNVILQAQQPTDLSIVISNFAPVPAIALGLGRPWLPNDSNTPTLWMMSAVLLMLYGLILITQVRKTYFDFQNRQATNEVLIFFQLAGLLTIGSLFVTFTYLSVKQDSNAGWFFIQESRYYSPFFGFLVLTIVNALFHPPVLKPVFRIVSVVLLVWIVIQTAITEIETWEDRMVYQPYGLYTLEDHPTWQYYRVVKSLADEGRVVVFLSSDPNNFYKGWANLAGASIHHSIHGTTIDGPIATDQPVTLVIFETPYSSEEGTLRLQQLMELGDVIETYENHRYKLFVVEVPAGAETPRE